MQLDVEPTELSSNDVIEAINVRLQEIQARATKPGWTIWALSGTILGFASYAYDLLLANISNLKPAVETYLTFFALMQLVPLVKIWWGICFPARFNRPYLSRQYLVAMRPTLITTILLSCVSISIGLFYSSNLLLLSYIGTTAYVPGILLYLSSAKSEFVWRSPIRYGRAVLLFSVFLAIGLGGIFKAVPVVVHAFQSTPLLFKFAVSVTGIAFLLLVLSTISIEPFEVRTLQNLRREMHLKRINPQLGQYFLLQIAEGFTYTDLFLKPLAEYYSGNERMILHFEEATARIQNSVLVFDGNAFNDIESELLLHSYLDNLSAHERLAGTLESLNLACQEIDRIRDTTPALESDIEGLTAIIETIFEHYQRAAQAYHIAMNAAWTKLSKDNTEFARAFPVPPYSLEPHVTAA